MPPPPCLKRSRNTEEISPPPVRRKILHDASPSSNPPVPTPEKSLEHERKDAKNRFEILSWNINGISHLLPERQKSIKSYFSKSKKREETDDDEDGDEDERMGELGEEKPKLRGFLRRHGWPCVVCLQEVKIKRGDEKTMREVERAVNGERDGKRDREKEPGYKAHFELPRDKFNARGWGGRVYGVCTLVREDLVCEMRECRGVEWDLEGRVVVAEFVFGKEETGGGKEMEEEKLVVINGYWPNGTMNPWRDSQSGVVRGTRHDVKRRFHELMLGEVLKHQREGWQVVLIGDMNIARDARDGFPEIRLGVEHVRNRRDFNEKFIEGVEGMGGVDSWRWVHGDRRGYSYHGESEEGWGSSCDRVDLGVVSRGLVGEWRETGIGLVGAEIWESVEERGGSDHVPISVVLDLGNSMKGGRGHGEEDLASS